jgi:KipI family sensor histidine kinase inhibitor
VIRALPAGDAGLLIESDLPPARLAAAIASAALPGVTDVVPGARTVLVIGQPATWRPAEIEAAIGRLGLTEPGATDDRPLEVPVVYDGQDLADVARLARLSVSEVIACHASGDYVVGWLGFTPGFGYLTGLDRRLAGVSRLDSPRLAVPAGSVAIAGGLTAVYPSDSPGGWRLIGRTATRMWDQDRRPPSLLTPGRRIRFFAVPPARQPAPASEPAKDAGRAGALPAGSFLEVVRPGPLATVQDLGRHGLGAVGVPPSGAADTASLIAANRLAGNPDDTAGIELTLGRAVFRCSGQARLAVTGAPATLTITSGADPAGTTPPTRTVEPDAAFELAGGSLLNVGAPATGLRTYVAVTGGIDVPAVLGSRSADLLSGLGGGPLRPGDLLPVGQVRSTGGAAATSARIPARGAVVGLRVIAGPRHDWFDRAALATLCGSVYQVTAASNRTGLRLDGPALARSTDAELPSEGTVTGALQVPHDGRPILLLADHPTVGGYPVIAVVASADISLAAQLRPGDLVTFNER